MSETESCFVYVTYIRATPERVWAALTDAELMRQYWFGMHCESDWRAGSAWRLLSETGDVYDSGEILEAEAPHRLVIRWHHQKRPELQAEGPSLCRMELEEAKGAVKLTITHSIGHPASKVIEAVSGGWPKVLSNLKSLLETGLPALQEAYPAQARA
ncbi:SRPBCC family protein [Acidisoma sp. 7E03]